MIKLPPVQPTTSVHTDGSSRALEPALDIDSRFLVQDPEYKITLQQAPLNHLAKVWTRSHPRLPSKQPAPIEAAAAATVALPRTVVAELPQPPGAASTSAGSSHPHRRAPPLLQPGAAIPQLVCEDKLCKYIGVATTATILTLADQHNCSGLKKACLHFLRDPAASVS
jgi:hypothetical protein